MIRGFFYRLIMRIAHRYNWHYAPPIYPENDIQLWCKWCGFRQTIKRCARPGLGTSGAGMVRPGYRSGHVTDPIRS